MSFGSPQILIAVGSDLQPTPPGPIPAQPPYNPNAGDVAFGTSRLDGSMVNNDRILGAFAALRDDPTGQQLGEIYLPSGIWTIDNIVISGFNGRIRGDRNGTWIRPGPSGKTFTFIGLAGGRYGMELDGLSLGDPISTATANNPINYNPAVPLIQFINYSHRLSIRRGSVQMSGDGTAFSFVDSYVSTWDDYEIHTGQYALPATYDALGNLPTTLPWNGATNYVPGQGVTNGGTAYVCYVANTAIQPGVTLNWQNFWTPVGGPDDTIALSNMQILGYYGPLARSVSAALHTMNFDSYKQVTSPNPGQVGAGSLIDCLLAVDADPAVPPFPQVIQVLPSGGGWAAGNNVYIEGHFDDDGVNRTGKKIEVNRVTNVSVGTGTGGADVLTLAWPLQYSHHTNGGVFPVQVLNGGVGPTLPANANEVEFDNSHLEGCGWGIMSVAASQITLRHTYSTSHRLARLLGGGGIVYDNIGAHGSGNGDNVVWDIPPWAALAAQATDISIIVPPYSLNGNVQRIIDVAAPRIDLGCTTTNGSPTVADANAVAADKYGLIAGPGIPANAQILAVNVGVGYTMNVNAGAAAGAGVAVTVTQTGVLQQYFPGQTVRGMLLGTGTTRPQRIDFGNVIDDPAYKVGTAWSFTQDSTAIDGGYFSNGNVQGDEIGFYYDLQAGTYSVVLWYRTNPAGAIISCLLDDVVQGTVDTGAAATNNHHVKIVAAMVVQTGGRHLISFAALTKGAGTAFSMSIHHANLRRTNFA